MDVGPRALLLGLLFMGVGCGPSGGASVELPASAPAPPATSSPPPATVTAKGPDTLPSPGEVEPPIHRETLEWTFAEKLSAELPALERPPRAPVCRPDGWCWENAP